MKPRVEVKRIKNIPIGEYFKTNCVECGKSIELYFNGGELDYVNCCGYDYSLEHVQIDFIVEKLVVN